MLDRAALSLTFAILFCSLTISSIFADITLPKIFSDHMVLQRNSQVAIWGTAEPEQTLIVKFDETENKIQASADGTWKTSVKTGDAGGPFELTIAAEGAETQVIFSNVMVGEVWLCAGASNMEWPVSKALNPETEIEQAKNYSNLRLFTVKQAASPKPLPDFVSVEPWSVCSPDTVKEFSAVAYFFGRELSKKLGDVPIGLIDISTSDRTPCEAWISNESLETEPALAPLLAYWKDTDDPTSIARPANLYHAMIAPIVKYPVRGIAWYQGEANVGRGQQYATLFPALIKDWREKFVGEDQPFLFVQPAPYRYEDLSADALPEVWDAQLQTLHSMSNVGLAVTVDVGNSKERNPKNKQAVGLRLALWALATTYQDVLAEEERDFVHCGPIYESMAKLEDRVRLTFKHTGNKLAPSSTGEPLLNFEVCGADKKFYPALATVVDEVVVEVTSPDVDQPIAVRFAWQDDCKPNLVNEAGLPASPFRTDNFPLSSEDRHF